MFLTAGSLALGDWRVTTGVLLGGTLSLLNVYWLKLSLKSLLHKAAAGEKPRFNSALYILRYIIIAMIVGFAAALKLVAVAATIVGLLSFAFAVLIEALIQFYFVIVNREDT